MILENRNASSLESMRRTDVTPTFFVSLFPVATSSRVAVSVSELVDQKFETLVSRGRFDNMEAEAREALEAGDLLDL